MYVCAADSRENAKTVANAIGVVSGRAATLLPVEGLSA